MPEFELLVNGRTHRVSADAGDSLLSVLRDDLNLTGSKFGCGEGHCGACTVLIDGSALRSCVVKLGAVAGKPITTIEGLAQGERLHPVQEAFLQAEAFQCGYCTPGMVMAATGLIEESGGNLTDHDVRQGLEGNLCRCTGYEMIVRSVRWAIDNPTPT
jgi:aerobic-type carbon monoxide dehydrogenase small subunit (CoxS/CutS family)